MKVFADLHHGDLFYSLQLLFEKRLKAELYRPVGIEWWKEGFWNVFNHPATAQQYLDFNSSGEENKKKLWHSEDSPKAGIILNGQPSQYLGFSNVTFVLIFILLISPLKYFINNSYYIGIINIKIFI